jgi:NTP pyrophosphatase (non-canonical NTP hydrolase)
MKSYRERVKPVRSFGEYQSIVEKTDERKKQLVSLLGLVGEVGDLHSMIKKLLIQKDSPTFRRDLREEFGDLLWYLTSLASLYKISLEEIASHNAQKTLNLYSSGKKPAFDSNFSDDERLPRQFTISFKEMGDGKNKAIKVTMNGVAVGDPLTDNSHTNDGYRYHDAFHLAYAAVLGWSPVVRGILKRKRKSKRKIDEIEDGARARIIEEAVSILIFNQAEERGWYADESSIDIGLLKLIKKMVSDLEVHACTAKQWQTAICQGFAAFKALNDNKGGELVVNLDVQKLAFNPHKEERPL